MKNINLKWALILFSIIAIQLTHAAEPLVRQISIHVENTYMRDSALVLGRIFFEAPADGRVVLRFDGYCVSDSGDRIVLAASNAPDWFPNDGNVAVQAPHSNFKRRSFSHTRVYDVTTGLDTFYAVGHNFVDESGSGIASIYGHLTLEFFPSAGPAMVIDTNIAYSGDVRSQQRIIAKLFSPLEPVGKVYLHTDGCVYSDPGDRIMISAANVPSWLVGTGSVAVMALGATQNISPFCHSRVFTQNASPDTFYTAVRNVVNSMGTGIASFYGNLSASFYPSSGIASITEKDISEDNLNARGDVAVIDSITITTTVPGYALAQLDGYCTSTVGDEMVFAVNSIPDWGADEGHISVSAPYSTNAFSTLSHSQMFYIPAGTHTYYAVVHNFGATAGNGQVDINGRFTVKFYADESVGITEPTAEQVSLYPNPVTSVLNIALPNNGNKQTIILTDLTGRVIQYTETANQPLVQLNMQYLPTGVYIVKGNGFAQKVIKQ